VAGEVASWDVSGVVTGPIALIVVALTCNGGTKLTCHVIFLIDIFLKIYAGRTTLSQPVTLA